MPGQPPEKPERHEIEQDVAPDEPWLLAQVAFGMSAIERRLKKEAAFALWLERHGRA